MSLWSNLVNAYNANEEILSLPKYYPLSTTSISNNSDMIFDIHIDKEGNFRRVNIIDKKKKDENVRFFTIPVSEKSMARTCKPFPHPLFETCKYLCDEKKLFEDYVKGLENFALSEYAIPEVQSVLKYITKKTIKEDIYNALKEYSNKKDVVKPKDKSFVLFSVESFENTESALWEKKELFLGWHNYYTKNMLKGFDSVMGIESALAEMHPKKIVSSSGNAKLISDNDTTNYTFRGRFINSAEALSVGYDSSQKAHQFLRYIVNKRGVSCGEQIIVSFALSNFVLPGIPISDQDALDEIPDEEIITDSDQTTALRSTTGYNFAEKLRKELNGIPIQGKHESTCVLMLDAASTGRLSVTYYRELAKDEYFERMISWHENYKWNLRLWCKDKQKYISYLGAPTIDKVVEVVYGFPRGNKDEGYEKVKKQARQILTKSIFDDLPISREYISSAVRRVSNPMSIKKGSSFDKGKFLSMTAVTCAIYAGFINQQNKEKIQMSIDLSKCDRDYLYGRLLGAADCLEEDILRQGAKERSETAAIRYMQTFSQRPFSTWNTIHNALSPYLAKAKNRYAFKELQAISAMFNPDEFNDNKPLSGLYLVGYYHEREYIKSLIRNTSKASCEADNTDSTTKE